MEPNTFWQITLGNVASIVIVIVGAMWALSNFRSQIEKQINTVTSRLASFDSELVNLTNAVKELSAVMTRQAVQDERIKNLERDMQERSLRRTEEIAAAEERMRSWVREQLSRHNGRAPRKR